MKTFVLSACALVLSQTLVAPTLGAEELKDVMSQYLEARGGLERLREVKTVSSSGTAVLGGGVEFPFSYEWKAPNKFRFELVIQGVPDIDGFDGTTAWEHNAAERPEATIMSPMDLALLNDAVDFVSPLVDADAKGHQLELVGKEDFEGTEVLKLKLTRDNGLVEYALLDAEHYIEIAQEELYDVQGQQLVLETIWGDYKEINGVMFPNSWQRRPKGGPPELTLIFEKMEVDNEISDDRFTMPTTE